MSKKRGLELFEGRTLVIATMHGKEAMIAPELKATIGVKVEVVQNLDTNQFGTFSGEVARTSTPFKTARNKAKAALALSGATLAVASEGSFGPHPSYFFVPGNEEILMLIDAENDLEIVGRYLTTETNFALQAIQSLDQLEAFAQQVGFPEHGIILKVNTADGKEEISKDLTTWEELKEKAEKALSEGLEIQAETDMRAMHNPTRMKAIREATLKLVDKLKSLCPVCETPGYGITETIRGLPCRRCGSETQSARAYRYVCTKCGHEDEKPRQDKQKEDPMYCDFCNP